MSWAQIRNSINSNLTRPLDTHISEHFTQQTTQINALNTRISTLETNLAAAQNAITGIGGQATQIIGLAARTHAVVSNTVRERLVLTPAVITTTADVWLRIARISTHVPGHYRLHIAGNFSSTSQTMNLRALTADRHIIHSTLSMSTTRFIDFHMNAGGTFFVEISHPAGQPQSSTTECTLCYDLVSIPRDASLTRN